VKNNHRPSPTHGTNNLLLSSSPVPDIAKPIHNRSRFSEAHPCQLRRLSRVTTDSDQRLGLERRQHQPRRRPGDVQVTALQLAVAYAAITNGGTIVRPHIGLEVESAVNAVLERIQPAPARHMNIDPPRQILSVWLFGNRGKSIAGASKTLCAPRPNRSVRSDQSHRSGR